MIQQRIKSFGYAIKGFKAVVRTEVNMRIHLILAITAIALGFILGIQTTEWMILLICIALVLAAEIANTVIEKYLDAFHPEIDPKIGILKDMSAAVVLLLALVSFIIGIIIFLPKLFDLFGVAYIW